MKLNIEKIQCPKCLKSIQPETFMIHDYKCKPIPKKTLFKHNSKPVYCEQPLDILPLANLKLSSEEDNILKNRKKSSKCIHCNEMISSHQYQYHEKNCQESKVMCQYCQIIYSKKYINFHYGVCSERQSTIKTSENHNEKSSISNSNHIFEQKSHRSKQQLVNCQSKSLPHNSIKKQYNHKNNQNYCPQQNSHSQSMSNLTYSQPIINLEQFPNFDSVTQSNSEQKNSFKSIPNQSQQSRSQSSKKNISQISGQSQSELPQHAQLQINQLSSIDTGSVTQTFTERLTDSFIRLVDFIRQVNFIDLLRENYQQYRERILTIPILGFEQLIFLRLIQEGVSNERGMSKAQIQKLKEVIYIETANQQLCTICYINFENQEKVCKLKCNHLYHKYCIANWLEINSLCPICKSDQKTNF